VSRLFAIGSCIVVSSGNAKSFRSHKLSQSSWSHFDILARPIRLLHSKELIKVKQNGKTKNKIFFKSYLQNFTFRYLSKYYYNKIINFIVSLNIFDMILLYFIFKNLFLNMSILN